VAKVIRIERVMPRAGIAEQPVRDSRGYRLGDPRHGSMKHHAANEVAVSTLEAAAELIERQGFSLRMGGPGKRGSLISPKSLRIIRTT
jgi:hypothetical protein